MIWIDVATPKYAMFFSVMIKELQKRGHKVFVTTRYAPHYTEAKEILELQDSTYRAWRIWRGNFARKVSSKNIPTKRDFGFI